MAQTPDELYRKYLIMPNLAEHQLRVAAVAKKICEHLDGSLPHANIISACLLHDMGNIIKFQLEYFPEFYKAEGLPYWQTVKKQFVETYGPDEHAATLAIAKEVGVSDETLMYINAFGFSKSIHNETDPDFGKKICAYSDMRVAPHAVVSLEERLREARERYAKHPWKKLTSEPESNRFDDALRSIEKQIFSRANIEPQDITEASTRGDREALRNFEVM